MMHLCLRYTKDEADARSVLNQGFYKVFKNVEKYDPIKATAYTWIRSIVVNCCLDHIKQKQSSVVTNELTDAEVSSFEPEVNSKIDAGEILELIRKLPPATQAVFNLYVIDGFGHKEIAALLQIKEGTSKWHLSEARNFLKNNLKQKEKTFSE